MGDTFDLNTLTVTPAKQKVAGSMPHGEELDSEAEPFMFPDILANTTVVEVLGRLMQRRKVEAIGLAFDGLAARQEPTQGFEFRFYPGEDSAGWYWRCSGRNWFHGQQYPSGCATDRNLGPALQVAIGNHAPCVAGRGAETRDFLRFRKCPCRLSSTLLVAMSYL